MRKAERNAPRQRRTFAPASTTREREARETFEAAVRDDRPRRPARPTRRSGSSPGTTARIARQDRQSGCSPTAVPRASAVPRAPGTAHRGAGSGARSARRAGVREPRGGRPRPPVTRSTASRAAWRCRGEVRRAPSSVRRARRGRSASGCFGRAGSWRKPWKPGGWSSCGYGWLNPPEWVESVDEPVPGYPNCSVPRDENAAKALKKRTDEPIQRASAVARRRACSP